MRYAYICDGVRTPIGRYGGALSSIRTDDLGAIPIQALMARHPQLDWGALEELTYGCVNQAGEDNRNVARMSALLAGLPVTVAASTVNRLCGSGLDAVGSAARGIACGAVDLAIAGGVESMSRAPFVMPKAATPFSRHAEVHDTTIGWRFVNPRMHALHGTDAMGDAPGPGGYDPVRGARVIAWAPSSVVAVPPRSVKNVIVPSDARGRWLKENDVADLKVSPSKPGMGSPSRAHMRTPLEAPTFV